jgi:hypothetical protein
MSRDGVISHLSFNARDLCTREPVFDTSNDRIGVVAHRC